MPADYWQPEEFAALARRPYPANLQFVVVEEIVDETVTLVATPWPRLDEQGRRDFGDESADDVFSLDLARAQQFLDGNRVEIAGAVPGEGEAPPVRRTLRLGDAFAMTDRGVERLKLLRRQATVGRARVIDVTRSARHAAKVAFSRAVGNRFAGNPAAGPRRGKRR